MDLLMSLLPETWRDRWLARLARERTSPERHSVAEARMSVLEEHARRLEALEMEAEVDTMERAHTPPERARG